MIYSSNADTIRRHEIEDRGRKFRARPDTSNSLFCNAPETFSEFSSMSYEQRAAVALRYPDIYNQFVSMEKDNR